MAIRESIEANRDVYQESVESRTDAGAGRGLAVVADIFKRMVPTNVIAAASDNGQLLGLIVVSLLTAFGILKLKGDGRAHLEGFFKKITSSPSPPRLISWNGNGFDLPVIRYRAMLHGVPMPALYRTDGEWKWNNYQGRYHDMHVDLMDVLSGYGASRFVGLGKMCDLLQIPSKSFLTKPIYEHILDGEQELVGECC